MLLWLPALAGCAGAAIAILGRGAGAESGGAGHPLAPLGFACAAGAALIWSSYSVLSRRLGAVPTETVTVFCLGTAALSLPVHLALEQTLWPVGLQGWLSVLALGLGPVGAAFFTWDVGMKKGDIQLLGVASYAAPVLSTLALVLAGITPASWTILAAALLIAGGAALAARASARRVTPGSGG